MRHSQPFEPELVLVRGSRRSFDPSSGAETLSWQAFQERLAQRGKRSQVRKYRGIELRVRCLDCVHRPLATAVLLRAISRGRCVMTDDAGRSRRVTLVGMGRAACRASADRLSAPALLRQTNSELDRVESLYARRAEPRFDPAKRPIYLRTDLTFGLTAGGSVGHVAGVLNTLDGFTAPPLWLTTDTLPTVREEIEHVLLDPGCRHWEHVERIALAANLAYAKQVNSAVAAVDGGLVYLRYGLNNYTGLRVAAERDLPLVVEFNGSEPWIAREWAGGSLRYETIAHRIESMNLKHADVVVVVSEPMRATAIELGAQPDRVLVNPNGVDTQRYRPDVDGVAVRERLGLQGKTVVGFIGTFDRWHGAPVLVEAVAKLLCDRPALRETLACVMIGDGPEFAQVQRLVAQHGLEGVVHLTGRVAQEEGPAYLAACDILASPHVPNADGSAFFGSPTKLFEYLAMGRAVVASRLGQLDEVLSHEDTALLAAPGDAAALAAAIARLVDDPALRDRLGAAGRAQAEREHTWRRHTERIIEKLASVCGV